VSHRDPSLLRKLLQAYVDLQAFMEKPAEVIGADAVAHNGAHRTQAK